VVVIDFGEYLTRFPAERDVEPSTQETDGIAQLDRISGGYGGEYR
jgi:hypothetical protein